jgi:hypothetical protein
MKLFPRLSSVVRVDSTIGKASRCLPSNAPRFPGTGDRRPGNRHRFVGLATCCSDHNGCLATSTGVVFSLVNHHVGCIEASRTLSRPKGTVSPPRGDRLLDRKTKSLSTDCRALQHAGRGPRVEHTRAREQRIACRSAPAAAACSGAAHRSFGGRGDHLRAASLSSNRQPAAVMRTQATSISKRPSSTVSSLTVASPLWTRSAIVLKSNPQVSKAFKSRPHGALASTLST